MTLFWPDSSLKAAQQNLRQTLYQLQKALHSENADTPLILSERYTLRMNPEATLTVDVTQFEALSASSCKPSDWETAVSLYRGKFLADFFLPNCDPFEEWAATKRAFYQRRVQEVLHCLSKHYLEMGDLASAETAVRRQLTLDNLQESAHRQLLKILAENGRRQEALTHCANRHQSQGVMVVWPTQFLFAQFRFSRRIGSGKHCPQSRFRESARRCFGTSYAGCHVGRNDHT